jgi:ATP-dependent RNA helicase DDX10/DBP4
MRRPQRRAAAKQGRLREADEIRVLNEWIDAGMPLRGTKPPPPSKSADARPEGEHPAYGACTLFDELPLSQKTKDGLRKAGYKKMSDIQRAAIPHALCGRDVLGAAKTGSGKTLAFIIPVELPLLISLFPRSSGVGDATFVLCSLALNCYQMLTASFSATHIVLWEFIPVFKF